ncbi:hypothetical protein HELRODRAFT_170339 [Helobdella robusta]|uniref:BTB domain-containing protein n=1 Tax=Helobdella robusta TaxID=6412 RepID=T1F2X8_HELRO|nr:hypothetical protein HELRODRAFT_170339 [Helobdella robusta]ESO07786.1 hypothetical protein HELRODRAFT_170339 [Helobdella robusta]
MDSCEKLFVGGYGSYETEHKLLNSMYDDSVMRSCILNIKTNFVNPDNPNVESDLTFVVGKTGAKRLEFNVHKSVLSQASVVFKIMLDGAFSKKKEVKKVTIEDVEPPSFSNFLTFVYHEELTLNEDNILDLVHLSHKYMMKDLFDMCFEFLVQYVSPENFLPIFEIVLFYNDVDTKDILLMYFRVNASEILNHSSIKFAPKHILIYLLQTEAVNVKETEFLKACVKWAKHKLSMKKIEFDMTKDIYNEMCGESEANCCYIFNMKIRDILGDEIVRNIRFPTMTKQEFHEAIKLAPVLTQSEINHINRAIALGKLDEDLSFSMKPRQTLKETCVDRFDTMKVSGEQVLGLDFLYFSTKAKIFMTGVGVVKKKTSSAVNVIISRLGSDYENNKLIGMGTYPFKKEVYSPMKAVFKRCLLLEPNQIYVVKLAFVNEDSNSKAKYNLIEMDTADDKNCQPHKRIVPSRTENLLVFHQPYLDFVFYNVPQIYYVHL